jgi:hypothetical protein
MDISCGRHAMGVPTAELKCDFLPSRLFMRSHNVLGRTGSVLKLRAQDPRGRSTNRGSATCARCPLPILTCA